MSPNALSPTDRARFAAAHRSVAHVQDGMKLGLGTGGTAAWMVRVLAARVQAEGLGLTCVPTSERTAALARGLGLRVATLDETGPLDLTIDGADEIDGHRRLIKGGGGALLREKIVAAASAQMIVIVDPAKRVETLGAFPLPIEVVRFAAATTLRRIGEVLAEADVGGRAAAFREEGGAPLATDNGNLIVDAQLRRIGDPEGLAAALLAVPGVVETGLFVGLCTGSVVGHPDGSWEEGSASGRVDPAEAARLPEPAEESA